MFLYEGCFTNDMPSEKNRLHFRIMTEKMGEIYKIPTLPLTKGQMNDFQRRFFSMINAITERINLTVVLKIEYLCQKNCYATCLSGIGF
jgi:hypothetical protein